MSIPDEVRAEAYVELARQFDELRWEEVSAQTASSMYNRFVKDKRIGGLLSPFMPENRIRVWIKDGPAKEYRRALEGVGPMASYTSRAYPGPSAIIESALGSGWELEQGTLEEKPMRCVARDRQDQMMRLVWGPPTALKEIFWNASLVRAKVPLDPLTIALTKPSSAPLSPLEWELARQLAELIDVDCAQVTYVAAKKPVQHIDAPEDASDRSS